MFLGHHHTEEAKRKISLANTGKTYPNRGLGVKKGPISLAASLHLSQLRKGIPKTPAYRKMMSRVLRGRQPKRAQLPQSGYRGVIWSEINKKWQVRIMYCGKTFYLGFYKDILDAAKVYNKASRKLFGKIAILNKLPSKENK